MTFKLPDTDKQLASQLWETRDQSAFEIGRLVASWIEDQEKQGTPQKEVYREFSKACKGASVRTLRFYAETVSHFGEADWEEFYVLSFDHFAKAAFLARNGLVPSGRFALEWAVRYAEKEGKGNFATADTMLGRFLPQEEIRKRELKHRISAFKTIRGEIAGLPEDKRRMAERLLVELEKIMGEKQKPVEKPTAEEVDRLVEKVLKEAGAERSAQARGVTLYTIKKAPMIPKGAAQLGFFAVSGIRTPDAALLWGARNHHNEVLWLKGREQVYVLRSAA
jgi:hypothetical protein